MNYTSFGFLSPVYAQIKILNNLRSLKQNVHNCAIIEANPCEDTMTNISTVPKLTPEYSEFSPRDYNIPLQALKELLKRSSERNYIEVLNSDRGRKIVSKAAKYNIPFDLTDIDFLDLEDKISDYEFLLNRAGELKIDWDEANYDLEELEEAILVAGSDTENDLRDDEYELRRDYYSSISL